MLQEYVRIIHTNDIISIYMCCKIGFIVSHSSIQPFLSHLKFGHIVIIWAPRPRFLLHVFCFFFFLPAFVDFGWQILLLWTVYALFTYCAYTDHVLKNIKNETHDTIYTFKYYFATVFSVFSFQFSATISSIQTHP